MVIFRDIDVVLRGSFKIIFYDKDVLSSDDKMCWCWFHSAIVARQKYINLPKDEVDGAVKDKASKHFTSDFAVEFWFDSPVDVDEETMSPLNDWIDAQNGGHNRNQDSLDMMNLHLRDIRSEHIGSKRRERPKPPMRKVHSNEIREGKVCPFGTVLGIFREQIQTEISWNISGTEMNSTVVSVSNFQFESCSRNVLGTD